ncbi:probable isocitrate dehydrogenase [NAD] subunit alpha, mitochondrial [Drosophila hydei]|uniref:isocitrate dehydrogenase (NAD(+)) n=1 Tax=Drosophila hydei TaxID=7224 RepID=A0A6J1LDB6_DROHY|nr:probable isocitrate dehydrogenase [NAD] subunit alpha, mitochondrial [Drosophila hydei]
MYPMRCFRQAGRSCKQLVRLCSQKGSEESKKCANLRAGNICRDSIKKDDKGDKGDTGDKCDKGDKDSKDAKDAKESKDNGQHKVTLLEGDGVGKELISSLKTVFEAAQVPVEWDVVDCYMVDGKINPKLLESLKRNKVGIKGPIEIRDLKHLWKAFGLYAYVTLCRNLKGQQSRYGALDCVVIRDVMEGEYSGIEHSVVPGIFQSIKVSTSAGSNRIARFVFRYAMEHKRRKITVAHKANIMKLTDGNFLSSMRTEAQKHLDKVKFEERYMDTTCLNLVMHPEQNDVLVSSSMYGDVLIVMASSISGGKALCPSFYVSKKGLLYDTLLKPTRDIAGMDLINPTGMLLSASQMLTHLKLDSYAATIRCAVEQLYKETDIRTTELGGSSKCSDVTQAVCQFISDAKKR